MSDVAKEIAGVKVPDSRICVAATEYAQQISEAFLFNHVMRSYAFGALGGQLQSMQYDPELYYISAVLHDVGLTDHAPANARFEVDGANMASQFLSRQGMSDADIDVVWDAIALHTCPGIPAAKGPEAALTQLGAALDVGVVPIKMIDGHLVEEIIEIYPRLGFKKALGQAMVGLYKRNPKIAQMSHVVSAFCERHVNGFGQPHFCDLLENAVFDE